MNGILRIQKRVVRIMAGVGCRETCRPIFKKLKIMTVINQYIYQSILYTRNNLNSLRTIDGHYATRQADDLRLPYSRTTLHQHSFVSMPVRMYNAIPRDIRRIENNKIFKVSVKSFLTENVYYSLNEFFESLS